MVSQPHSREGVYSAGYQYLRLGHWSYAKAKVVSHIARVGGVSALGQVPVPPSRVTVSRFSLSLVRRGLTFSLSPGTCSEEA